MTTTSCNLFLMLLYIFAYGLACHIQNKALGFNVKFSESNLFERSVSEKKGNSSRLNIFLGVGDEFRAV